MVVIGGLVGAGALGYDAVLGFARSEEWGKGAAAGITIVLLGIMIDRICRAAAAQQTGASRPAARGPAPCSGRVRRCRARSGVRRHGK